MSWIKRLGSGQITSDGDGLPFYSVQNGVDRRLTVSDLAAYVSNKAGFLKGDKGVDGDSAYQLALENGFSGTEEEWLLSLVGPAGPQGPQGDPGSGGSSAWVDITGKPTTLAGYGITDAATVAQGAKADTALQPGASIPWTNVTGKPTFFSGAYGDLTGIPATFAPSAHTHIIANVTGLQTALDGKQPLATVLTNTTAAFTTGQETKLAGIATGATANATDAALRDRATHTGVQAIATVTGLQTALDGKLATGGEAATVATINGRITQGTNVTITGAGTAASPYNISASGGGGGVSDGTYGGIVVTGSGTLWNLNPATAISLTAEIKGTDLTADDAAGTFRAVSWRTGGLDRWIMRANNTTESGSNAGSNLALRAHDDAGAFLGTVFDISRATQVVDFAKTPTIAGLPFDGIRSSSPLVWKASAGVAAPSAIGGAAPTAIGTNTLAAPATTNLFTRKPRTEYLVTVAATTAIAGWRGVVNTVTVGGDAATVGGFFYRCDWGPATGVATATSRAFVGLRNLSTAPTDVEPSTLINCIGMGWDAADTNVQIMHNDGSGACTKIDLGFAVPTADRTQLYELEMFSPKGTTQSVTYTVTNINTGAVATGTVTTNLPGTTALLSSQGWMSVGGTSSVIGIALNSMWLDPLY